MYKQILGIILTGIVIKIMDDYLDKELDSLRGQPNFAGVFGSAVLPYSLLFFGLALYLNPVDSLALFMASYVVGMTMEPAAVLPSNLRQWQEIALVLLFGWLLLPGATLAAALLFMLLVQLLDDFVDLGGEARPGYGNLVYNLGIIPSALSLGLLLLVLSHYFYDSLIRYTLGFVPLYLLLITGERLRLGEEDDVD